MKQTAMMPRQSSLLNPLGHSQINTTLIYSHLSESHLAKEANKVMF